MGDVDSYGRSLYGGYPIWSVSDGRKVVRRFSVLNMCAAYEYDEPNLVLVSGRPYLFLEPAPILLLLSEHVTACVVHQVAKPHCLMMKIQTTCLPRNTFSGKHHNNCLW